MHILPSQCLRLQILQLDFLSLVRCFQQNVNYKHSCLWYEQNYHLGDTQLSIFFSILPSVQDQENGKILLDHCSYFFLKGAGI